MNRYPSAFPRPMTVANDALEREVSEAQDGMTLRDYFAGQALAGLLANTVYVESLETGEKGHLAQLTAMHSYKYADAMLEEREKK